MYISKTPVKAQTPTQSGGILSSQNVKNSEQEKQIVYQYPYSNANSSSKEQNLGIFQYKLSPFTTMNQQIYQNELQQSGSQYIQLQQQDITPQNTSQNKDKITQQNEQIVMSQNNIDNNKNHQYSQKVTQFGIQTQENNIKIGNSQHQYQNNQASLRPQSESKYEQRISYSQKVIEGQSPMNVQKYDGQQVKEIQYDSSNIKQLQEQGQIRYRIMSVNKQEQPQMPRNNSYNYYNNSQNLATYPSNNNNLEETYKKQMARTQSQQVLSSEQFKSNFSQYQNQGNKHTQTKQLGNTVGMPPKIQNYISSSYRTETQKTQQQYQLYQKNQSLPSTANIYSEKSEPQDNILHYHYNQKMPDAGIKITTQQIQINLPMKNSDKDNLQIKTFSEGNNTQRNLSSHLKDKSTIYQNIELNNVVKGIVYNDSKNKQINLNLQGLNEIQGKENIQNTISEISNSLQHYSKEVTSQNSTPQNGDQKQMLFNANVIENKIKELHSKEQPQQTDNQGQVYYQNQQAEVEQKQNIDSPYNHIRHKSQNYNNEVQYQGLNDQKKQVYENQKIYVVKNGIEQLQNNKIDQNMFQKNQANKQVEIIKSSDNNSYSTNINISKTNIVKNEDINTQILSDDVLSIASKYIDYSGQPQQISSLQQLQYEDELNSQEIQKLQKFYQANNVLRKFKSNESRFKINYNKTTDRAFTPMIPGFSQLEDNGGRGFSNSELKLHSNSSLGNLFQKQEKTQNQKAREMKSKFDYKDVTPAHFAQRAIFGQNKTDQKENLNQQQWTLSNFQIAKSLGKGIFGRVYLAQEKKTRYLMALKVMEKKKIKKLSLTQQTMKELKIHSCLNHPNIVQCYGFFDTKDKIIIALEYCFGGNLFEKMYRQKTRKFSEMQAANYVKQIIDAVQYLHENGIIHRDIKPENILLNNDTVKLSDFGIASQNDGMRQTFCGTLEYVSPEIIGNKLYDIYVDVWAIGVLAYELCNGDPPFMGAEQKQTISNVRFKIPKHFSNELSDFVQRILKKEPRERMNLKEALKHPWIQNNILIYEQKLKKSQKVIQQQDQLFC